jgi:17beta-estradiol 17-dehydrogenase / very-long-chain 3-oxoacyl-CoA reductase
MSIPSLLSTICNCDCTVVNGLLYAILAVGVFKVTTTLLSFGAIILESYLLPSVNFAKYGANKGNWAVVTGASDGIGKEYAFQLAKRGFNIVLVSRTQSKLEAVATEIESKYKKDTKIVAFDATTDAPENYESLSKALEDLPISILVNNVGQSHSIPVSFLDTTDDEMKNIITLNNIVTLKITKLIAPLIVSNSKKQKGVRGLILTMGSFAGLVPSPLLSVYSGSKAFLQNWSAALAGELKSEGVDVELVISYLVTSAMSKIKRSSFTIPNPKQFVSATLKNVGRRVGAQERYATITPYPSHALMHWAIDTFVGVYSKTVNKVNLNMHQSIRKRALKRAARLEAEKKQL